MRARPALPLLLLGVLAAGVYAPGIGGGFAFDDYFAIVLNDELDIDTAGSEAVLDAMFSSNSGPLKRPVAMLSFAANRSLTGIDPLPFKLTNIAIHAVNAALVLLLFRLIATALAPFSSFATPAAAWLAAALWAVHPINLTSVLYVAQRMTSLCGTWMLMSLVAYAAIRVHQIQGRVVERWRWAPVWLGAVLALLTKETAMLLPLYVCVLELSIFRFEGNARLRPLFWRALILGACAATAVLVIASDALLAGYAGRSFTLGERLLTEARVVMFYLRLIFVPDVASFALFHDDIEISRGFVDPPTTILSLAGLALLVVAATAARRRYITFGIAWFLGGHLLESTVYPLELVHEHRNYLPALGIAFMSVFAVAESLARVHWQRRRLLLAAAALGVFAVATAIRASIWADPAAQIEFEARHHPRSARSQYELGRTRLELGTQTNDRIVRAAGVEAMERAAELAPIPTLALTALLISGVDDGDGARVQRVLSALRGEDRDGVRVGVFEHFVTCQAYGRCADAPDAVRDLADAILGGPPLSDGARRDVIEWLAIYYMRVLGDAEAALDMLAELAAEPVASYITRARYAEALYGAGRREEAADVAREVRQGLPWATVFTQRPLRRRLKRLMDPAGGDA